MVYKAITLLLYWTHPLVQAACSSGNELCIPWTSTAIVYGPPPSGATNCDVHLHAVDNDYNTMVFMSGVSYDSNRVHATTGLSCFGTNDQVGYVTRWDSGTLTWEKFFFGSTSTPTSDAVVELPFIGLSRSALAHTRGVYTDFVLSYMKMELGDYLMIQQVSDGTLVNMHKIETSVPG